MSLFKGIKDMGAMLTAAPGLIQSANELAANAQAQGQAMQYGMAPVGHMAPVGQAVANDANLTPISGVTLEQYAAVSKGIATYGYDAAMLPTVAAAHGIAAASWADAQTGWAARIQNDRGIGARFNQLYTQV